jgi:hypothetical protein
MKTFGLLSIAGLVSALAVATPALAHEGWYGHGYYGPRHIVYPVHRVVIGTPLFAPRAVVVVPPPVYYAPYYAPAPVYYTAPAPVYPAPSAAATVGGAIAGAAIGAIASNGRPSGIAAGTVVGALVGNSLAR